jgi:signal transduction histidine kinase
VAKRISSVLPTFNISRQLAVRTLVITLIIVIIDLLTTRQILPYNNTSEDILFVITMVIITIASVILLGYVKRVVKAIFHKSLFIKVIFLSVVLIQLVLLGILWTMTFTDIANCHYHFSLCDNTNYHNLVNIISAMASTAILIAIGYKFFSWYRTNYRNFLLLLFGLTALGMIISLVGDNINELLLTRTISEKSPPGSESKAFFLYHKDKKFGGEIQYVITNPDKTTLLVRPYASLNLSAIISPLTSYPHNTFRWFSVVFLLYYYYKTQRMLKFWILTSIPLILFIIGSGFIFSLPSDSPYKFYLRVVFRAGNIGNSLLFGYIFYYVLKNIRVEKVKDYLIIAAMDIVLFDLAFSTSAYQPTYGIAAHSLVLLCACFISLGWYSLATSIAQDKKLRETIRKEAKDESKLLISIGSAQLQQRIEQNVINIAKRQEEVLAEQTGVFSSLTENGMKEYLATVLKEIKVIQKLDEILKKGKEILESSYQFVVCSEFGGLRLVYNNFFDLYENVMDRYRKGEHKGIRMITSITDKDNANLVRKFLDIGVHIKHATNMPPIDFAISDKEMIATIEKSEGGEGIKSLLVSNEYPYISHFLSIFEELWRDGTDARDRIQAIQEGREPETFEVIADQIKAAQILVDLSKSAREEALFLLPNDNAMIMVDKLGIIGYLMKASQNGSTVKIICPLTEQNSDIVKRLSTNAPDIRILNGHNSSAGFLIVDSTRFLRFELKEPSAKEFSEAIGFTLYSNSKGSVDSFKYVFDLLWNEHMINEQLQKADEMQKEFIHIAAHELRNPIQPILGITEVMRSRISDPDQIRMLDITIRNAKKLRQLTEDILDVSKIESQKPIQLNKEIFNLTEILLNTVADFRNEIAENKNNNISLELLSCEHDIIVEADKSRVNQVIMNLISNAIKFTKEGNITISTEKKMNGFVMISIKDTGSGLDPEILPRLFSKFVSKSFKGTGLGLFISKSIIEEHGGKIWAENNANGKGATFYFSLPISSINQ